MENPASIVSIERGREIRRARENRSNCRIVPDSELQTVPILPWACILAWLDTDVAFDPHDALDWLPFPISRGGPRSFALTVEDEAMDSDDPYSYPRGSLIFVDPDHTHAAQPGDRILVLLSDGRTMRFRQLARCGEQRVLEAMNPAYPLITGPFRTLGKVVARLVSDS